MVCHSVIPAAKDGKMVIRLCVGTHLPVIAARGVVLVDSIGKNNDRIFNE